MPKGIEKSMPEKSSALGCFWSSGLCNFGAIFVAKVGSGMDFGGHFGDFLARGGHRKLNDVIANMKISEDRRLQKTGLKTGCKKGEQTGTYKVGKWRPEGSIRRPCW